MHNNQEKLHDLFQTIASASLFFIPFLLFLALAAFFLPVDLAQYQNSDPLIRLLSYPNATIITLLLGLAISAFWIVKFRFTKNSFLKAGFWTLAGSGFAFFICWLIYQLNGPQLPAFIPPEESAASGLVLGLSAGMLEEIIFRLLLLPLFLVLFCKQFSFNQISFNQGLVLSVLLTSLLFALSHELAGDPFQLRYFLTRFIMPGIFMSWVFLKIHPAALLSAHTTAHVGIALFFTAA